MRYYILFFLFSYNSIAFTQYTCAFNPVDNMILCLDQFSTDQISDKMNFAVDNILNPIGLSRKNFIVKSCKQIENAAAIIYKNNRYILMDELFFSSKAQKNAVTYYLILSHEIAHHLHGHTSLELVVDNSKRQSQELECDYFAGFVLSSLGYNLEEVKAEASIILSDHNFNENSTHPPLSRRIEYISRGYLDSQKNYGYTIDKIYSYLQNEYRVAFEKNLESRFNYMFNDARNGYFDVILNNKYQRIDEVISKYNKIDLIFGDFSVLHADLGQLYKLKKDYNQSYSYFLSAYKMSDQVEYLLSAYQVYYEGDIIGNDSVFQPLLKIDYTSLKHPNFLKFLAIYTSQYKPEKSIEILTFCLNNWPNFDLNEKEKYLESNILSDLSVIYVRQENYNKAFEYINKSLKIWDLENTKTNTFSSEDSIDIVTILDNKALIELRLEKFSECIQTCELIALKFPQNLISHGNIYYYQGRSYFELKEYRNALDKFNLAIKVNSQSNYLYFYRGLIYLKLGDEKKANIDFTISCDNGIQEACNLIIR